MASNTTDRTAGRAVKDTRLRAVSKTALRNSATAREFVALAESRSIVRLIIPRYVEPPPPEVVAPDIFGSGNGNKGYYANGLYVVVGANTDTSLRIQYSTDGVIWSTASGESLGNSANGGTDILYANGIWVATGSGGTNRLLYSTNGTHWNQVSGTQFSTSGTRVAYGNNRWVAVGLSSNKTILYSDNGITWNDVPALPFSEAGIGLLYANGRFVAMGRNLFADGSARKIVYSNDGITWTNATITTGQTCPDITSFAYGNGVWVAAGQTSVQPLNKILYSTDNGVTWNGGQGTFSTNGYVAVAYGGGRFVATGGDNLRIATIIYSDDGINWSLATGTKVSNNGGGTPTKVSYANGQFMLTGSGDNPVLYSDDGKDWKKSSVPPSITSANYAFYGNGKWVILK